MSRVVRVLPDEPALDRDFDYLLPDRLTDTPRCPPIQVGTIVRVDLRGRRIRGWITAVDVDPPPGVDLREITKVSSCGPPAALVDLAAWACRQWMGSRVHFLRTATHDRVVSSIPEPKRGRHVVSPSERLAEEAFRRRGAVVRTPPNSDDFVFAVAAASYGRALILTPTLARAQRLAVALRRAGIEVAVFPRDWEAAAVGAVTIGARSAAWAPIDDLDAVLVLDEHDESYQQQSAPTWHARDVVLERAKRDGAAWVIASPTPSLEALTCGAPLLTPDRAAERAGWSVFDVVDLRDEPPLAGAWCSDTLSRQLRHKRNVVCVLNRKGRARFAYCAQCGELARSEVTGRPLGLDGKRLVHPIDGDDRPAVCQSCSSTKFRRVKLGVTGVAEELERIARRPVGEVTSDTEAIDPEVELYVGTEAVLHRVERADVVVFLDFDQELLAPRYRAAEQAMSLLVQASRVVGRREDGGRVLIQTRIPQHPVLEAALSADPSSLARTELGVRRELRQPPEAHWAIISGTAATEFVRRIGTPAGLEITGPTSDRWRIRSDEREDLVAALKSVDRPPGRLRIEIDPLRA